MNRDSKIIKLVNEINLGKVSPDNASKILDNIEKKEGPFGVLYEVENRVDQDYYEELLANARLGIYSRESLLKMAQIKYVNKKARFRFNKTKCYVSGIIVLFLFIVLIVSILKGKS